ncbi:MAG: hypothetical protein KC502_11840 [Myxococcales bacterium]|nr:hypothetical protein [Myxococcales bacterium]
MTILKRGSRGTQVRRVQQRIGLSADGFFGRGTETAMKAHQTDQGLDGTETAPNAYRHGDSPVFSTAQMPGVALAADITERNETGRSRPGLEVVLRIADALHLSLRDKNALLVSAGLTPVFSERTLDDEALTPIRDVIDRVMDSHDPYPAFAFAPGLRILKSNATGERMFPGMAQMTPSQLIQAWCSPRPDVPAAEVLQDAWRIVTTLRHELRAPPHPDIPNLLSLAETLAQELGPVPTTSTTATW